MSENLTPGAVYRFGLDAPNKLFVGVNFPFSIEDWLTGRSAVTEGPKLQRYEQMFTERKRVEDLLRDALEPALFVELFPARQALKGTNMHSYDHDPIYQAGVVEAFNSGLAQATIALIGDGTSTDPTLAPLIAKIEALQKPVPAVPEAYANWAASGPPDGAPMGDT
jgi:hypothetical protein